MHVIPPRREELNEIIEIDGKKPFNYKIDFKGFTLYLEPKAPQMDLLQSGDYFSEKVVMMHPLNFQVLLKSRRDKRLN